MYSWKQLHQAIHSINNLVGDPAYPKLEKIQQGLLKGNSQKQKYFSAAQYSAICTKLPLLLQQKPDGKTNDKGANLNKLSRNMITINKFSESEEMETLKLEYDYNRTDRSWTPRKNEMLL